MGQGIYNYISSQCDALSAQVSPNISTMGSHMMLALATIMLVWFGAQEAISSAQGGGGLDVRKLLNFVLLMTFAYSFVTFYNSPIPGLGFSLQRFVIDGADNLVQLIGTDLTNQLLQFIDGMLAKSGTATPSLNIIGGLYVAFTYIVSQICMIVLDAVITLTLAYGAIGTTIIGILGPIFIPFVVFDRTEFLFWGWLRAFIGFAFFKVIAAATLSIIASVYLNNSANLADVFSSPVATAQSFPFLLFLAVLSVVIIARVPAITMWLFSGNAGSSSYNGLGNILFSHSGRL